jgi:hypothetical protein
MIEAIRFVIGGLFLALIQTLIFKEVNIAWWIKPMPYIYLFLILPLSNNKFGVLIGAFFFGLTIDAFGGSLGMHTAACVTTVFIKNYIDKNFLDENSMQLQGMRYMQIDYKGWQWYGIYTFSILFIHHLVYFIFDYFSWSSIFTILFVAACSSLASLVFIQIFRLILGHK